MFELRLKAALVLFGRACIFACLIGSMLVATPQAALAGDKFIVLQSTTSTQNSGLLSEILPDFTESTGIEVRVVAVGTGQALKNARNGDGDVLLVHARSAEEEFVEEGWGVARHDVMYNDFVIVGPRSDPAAVHGMTNATDAMRKIASNGARFVSRGDDSGTHRAELRLWEIADVDAVSHSGDWYLETGSGMGSTLNTGIAMDAYALTDRATWISFGNKATHEIVVQDDPRLFNQYGVILVNPDRHPRINADQGQQFIDWLIGTEGQSAIAKFRVDAQQLFFPNFSKPENGGSG